MQKRTQHKIGRLFVDMLNNAGNYSNNHIYLKYELTPYSFKKYARPYLNIRYVKTTYNQYRHVYKLKEQYNQIPLTGIYNNNDYKFFVACIALYIYKSNTEWN